MTDSIVPAMTAGVRRCAGLCLALAASLALLGAVADGAHATDHDYCNWDGSYNATAASTLCFQSGENSLVNNHALLPYVPVNPTIFCGAHIAGVQYAGYTGGNPTCDHGYSGANTLKADEYVDTAATTHGIISY